MNTTDIVLAAPGGEAEYEYTTFEKAFVLIPKASGFLSMAGSMSIILHILQSKKRRKLVYHRLLLGMSISDFVCSFFFFLSSWLVPKGTNMYLASGNTATCTFHGLFAQATALTTPSYNAALSIYYVLVVCWELPERKVRKWEVYFHGWSIALGLGTGIAGLPLELYNPTGFHCWINGLPAGCDTQDDVECQRGNLSWVFRWAFMYAWIWFYFVVIAICIGSIYKKVLKQERNNDRYSIPGLIVDRKRSRRVAYQASLYVGAYCLTFLFGTISRSLQMVGAPVPESIWICFVVFFPLQGFFNAMIYAMPRYHRWRNKNKYRSGSLYFGEGSSFVGRRRRPSNHDDVLRPPTSSNQRLSVHMSSDKRSGPDSLNLNASQLQQVSVDMHPPTQQDKEGDADAPIRETAEDVMSELPRL